MSRDLKSRSILSESSDHDLLITLVATVQNNHLIMLDKVGNLQTDLSDVKTGSNYTLTEHEQRIRSLEKTRDEVNPQEAYRLAREAHDFAVNTKRDQKAAQNRQTVIISVIVVLINIAISLLTNVLGIFPLKH